jgi:predicted SAM-dependent methyltransferase
MSELYRVLKPGGTLRLSLPNLDQAIAAYQSGTRDYFHIRDWKTISGNFITHVLWYSLSRTLFTYEFAEELLRKAGFSSVQRVEYRQTLSSYPEIVELDNRKNESFFVEAVK